MSNAAGLRDYLERLTWAFGGTWFTSQAAEVLEPPGKPITTRTSFYRTCQALSQLRRMGLLRSSRRRAGRGWGAYWTSWQIVDAPEGRSLRETYTQAWPATNLYFDQTETPNE